MDLKQYIFKINKIFQTGDATEHSYRGELAEFVHSLLGTTCLVVNEPARIKCGAPDYVVLRAKDTLPVFYIEAKDIGDNDLDGNRENCHKEQFDRYKQALGLVVFTDYIDFHFYVNGEWVENIRIGEVHGNRIDACMDMEAHFADVISSWGHSKALGIKGVGKLASAMASKARLLRHVTLRIMNSADTAEDSQLRMLYNSFKSILVSDLDHERFADMYAQTLVYGLFAARLSDTTPDDFSRAEAAMLIPKSNPFLRTLFNNIVGCDLDGRIAWIVDDLVDVFAASDVRKLMKEYGEDSNRNDPMVHFYEDFLKEYDQQLRKDMGVWYTPKPVVNFIVRSVDFLLRTAFGFRNGLADRSKTEVDVAVADSTDKRTKDGKKHVKIKAHRLQILDPAAGTGTFLAEVVRSIHDTVCRDNAGLWNEYVENDLKPRLNGFELMVAPYTIAHIKMDMVLSDLGFDSTGGRRLKIFLADSLTEPSAMPRNLFNAISVEANEADKVKRDMPIMVVLGNPPYNGESQNRSEWIMRLMDDYKKEPGGLCHLSERNTKWLNDDYVKFIRMAQGYVQRGGKGLVAYICPHGFLDNPTFRGMRWNLLSAFNHIYVLNLHGNSNRGEVCPDGSKDENVFSIMQGVCICIFVKTGELQNGELGTVSYADLWGTRESKLQFLQDNCLENVKFENVEIEEPMYFFVPKDFSLKKVYDMGFAVDDLFSKYSMGITTAKDNIVVCGTRMDAELLKTDLEILSKEELRKKYKITRESSNWSIDNAKKDLVENMSTAKVVPYAYRPFDKRYVVYTGKSNGVMCRPRHETISPLLQKKNLGLCTIRVGRDFNFPILVVENIADKTLLSSKDNSSVFPLYLYTDNFGKTERVPNFSEKVYEQICDKLGFRASPEQLFNYIYAVLHSQSYRELYKEFLKVDFPRVPYPDSKEAFMRLEHLGEELVDLHLMHHSDEWETRVGYPVAGNNMVELVKYEDERVYINSNQYFSNVAEDEWSFMMGSYQPAQKWLKDRKNKKMSADEIIHYEQMLYAIRQTLRIMKDIDAVSWCTYV